MIPGADKNKGAVLQNACKYIQDLQAKIDSFENERHVFEITQGELTNRNDSLRDSAQRAWQETAKWMGRCREANLQFGDYDQGIETEVLEDPTNNTASGIPGGDTDYGMVVGGPQKTDSNMA
jgi:FtsZ-binding cell division protein ZapB